MHGLSWISASWSRSKLKTKNTKPMGDHSHNKQWYAPAATYLTLYFHPPTSAQNPCFLPKIVTLSPIFVTLSRILEIFHSKTLMSWNLRKRYPNAAYLLWLLSLRDPLFFCLYTCLFLKHGQKLENFVFSKQNRAIKLVNTFRCKFNKGDENKISVLQAQPTQLCIIWMNFIGGQGWYTGYYPPSQTRRGYILQTPSYKSAPLAL